MIVRSIPHEAAVRDADREILTQTERQQRFGRHVDRAAMRVNLRAGASRRAYRCADRRALAAAGNRARVIMTSAAGTIS